MLAPRVSLLALLVASLATACSKSKSKSKDKDTSANVAASTTVAPGASAPAPSPPAIARNTGCRGTMSGPASGPFTCLGPALLFMPTYKDAALRGNTEVSLMSSPIFQNGTTPPPGVDLITWSSVVHGTLRPGTYTEKDLITGKLDTAAVRVGKKQVSGLKRLKFVVKSVTAGDVHEDVMTKGGPMREYKIAGDIELVIGDAPDQFSIRATLD